MKSKIFIVLIAAYVLSGFLSESGSEIVKIGALNDVSGATSDVGRDYALGVAEAIRYVNESGGINDKKIKLYQFDYGYRLPEALTKYKLFKRLKVAAILGWGTGDTEVLSPFVTRDKIPYMSASYSAHLTNPNNAPFNLFAATDYSSNARASITAWFDEKWPEHNDYGRRKPRIQCSYMFDSPYAASPIKAIKDQAELFGFIIGPDLNVSLYAIETSNQLKAMKKFKPDVVWHGNTTMSVSSTIRDAFAQGVKVDHIVNNWGFDENLLRLAGPAAEGVMGASVCAFYGEDAPMMDTVREYGQKYNPGVPSNERLVRTVQAWANVLALREALRRADIEGGFDGENILKNGFETFNGFDIGLGMSPLTYTSTDHRIAGKVPIYEIKNGKIALLTTIDLKNRWPSKWAKDWFGW